MLGGLAIWPLIIFAFSGAPACFGFESPTLQAIEACPAAVEALGTPVGRSWLGLSCGGAETSGDSGNASWTFPVAGPRGSGSIDVVATQIGGRWTLSSAVLDTGGGTIDVLTCTTGGGGGIAAATYEGTVRTTIGAAPASVGDACRIEVTPSSGGSYPCRVVVACDGRTLYGAGTTGYLACGLDTSRALTARDDSPTPNGGDPMLDLRASHGEVIVHDQAPAGAWAVSIAFTP
jgi:hypothetical protein